MADTEILLTTPDPAPIQAEHLGLVNMVNALTVTNKEEHERAQIVLGDIGRAMKLVKEKFAGPKADAHRAHKSIAALERELLTPLTRAKNITTGKLDDYEAAERRRVEQERRRLEAAERARQEKERKEAEDRQLAAATAAEEAGDDELAAELLDAPLEPVAPAVVHVPTQTAKVEGVGSRTIWSAKVNSLLALIRHVAANPSDEHLLEPCMKNLHMRARAARGALDIPGVRAVSQTVRSVRSV